MKYKLQIINVGDGRVFFIKGIPTKETAAVDRIVFNVYIPFYEKHPQLKREEYVKDWKCLRYYMRIQLLKIKMAEINK